MGRLKKRRPIIAIDCETDPFKFGRLPKPFIWGMFDGTAYRHWPSFKPLLKHLIARDEKMLVYAHNGGRFDFLFREVVEQIPSGTAIQIIHGRVARFRIGDLEFRDSLAAVPVALGKYKKDTFAYWKLKKEHREKYRPQIIDYLGSDVRNLHELMTEFTERFGPSLTLAGASMKAAAKIEDFTIPKSTPAYFRDLKPFYFGGMVRCLSKGKVKGPVKLWDINSAYPWAMLQKHPWGAQYHLATYKGGRVPNQSCLVIDCEAHGVFPFGEVKGGTSFPSDGKRRTFRVTGWEYNAAKECGLLGKNPKIGDIYTFPEHRSLKKYIEHFYAMRKAAPDGSAEKLFGKLFMNSCYGRFGIDGSAYEQYRIDEPSNMENLALDGWAFRSETEDGRFIYCRPEPKERWNFHDVATALSVTGCVRAHLVRTIYGKKGILATKSAVHYIDTDGVQTTGPWKAKESKELGDWKLEAVAKAAYYGGKKLYALDLHKKYWYRDDRGKLCKWKKAHKGAVLTADEIVSSARDGKTVTYKKDAPSMGLLSGVRWVKRRVKRT